MSKVILIGSPNSGKSLLFNRLTGLHQKVSNFPGVTVDVSSGAIVEIAGTTLVDFPGTYSLQPISGEERVATQHFTDAVADPGESWLGWFGQLIEPVFEPLGLDWRYGVAILSSFLAREVFVGTLGTIFVIEGAEENMVPLVEQIQASGLSLASGVSLLVFFAIALMCVSSLAILGRESGSSRLAVKMFVTYGIAAYIAAVFAYRLTLLLPI